MNNKPSLPAKASSYQTNIPPGISSVSSVLFLESIFEKLGGRRSGVNTLCYCPVHNGSQRNLSLAIGRDGKLLAHCFAGCDYKDIVQALEQVAGGKIEVTAKVQTMHAPRSWARKSVDKLWNESLPILPQVPAGKYFRNRLGDDFDFSLVSKLKHRVGLDYRNDQGEVIANFPCIVSPVRNVAGELITLHRTYITVGGSKAPVNAPKKIMPCEVPGSLKGASIQLEQANDLLAVAEGLETALAIRQKIQVPTWATVTALGMENLIVPLSVKEIWIFADNDRGKTRAGEKAAHGLAKRLKYEGKRVKIFLPSQLGADFADLVGGVAC